MHVPPKEKYKQTRLQQQQKREWVSLFQESAIKALLSWRDLSLRLGELFLNHTLQVSLVYLRESSQICGSHSSLEVGF